MKEKIIEYFELRKDEMIKNIAELVAIESVRGEVAEGMPFGKMPYLALQKALEIAEGFGFKTQNHEGYVGTVDMGEGEPELGILAHLDVVPVGEGWNTNPFEVIEKDGKIFGRGVSDDKGPAIAALYAMKAVRDLDFSLSKNCRLILGTDEECGSSDIKHYFAENPYPKYTFTPDAEFPVTNGEKGRFAKHFCKKADFSGCGKYIKRIYAGEAANAVSDCAEVELAGVSEEEILLAAEKAKHTGAEFCLESGKIICRGTSAHASLPENGNNPITAMFEFLSNIAFDERCAELVGALKALFPHGKYNGESFGVDMSDKLGRLTLTLDTVRLENGEFVGCFDARVPMTANEENCAEPIAERLSAYGFEIENTQMTKAHYVDEKSEFVQTLLDVYEKYTGDEGECVSMGGGTYVHGIENGVAFGAISKGTVTNMHGANEFMPIADILTAAEIFAEVIVRICGENKEF